LYRNGGFYGSGIVVQEQQGKRSASHSRVMIHQPSGGARKMRLIWNQLARNVETRRVRTNISHHSGQTFDKVHKDSERDYWMKAMKQRILE
jgi:ATP-dependent Clp protease protease subunit